MLKKTLEDALNKQINHEFHAAYNYLAMSAYLDGRNLPGFAAWMYNQYKEELVHAMKIYAYIHDRAGKVVLDSIARPDSDYNNIVAVFEKSLKMEEDNTAAINSLYKLAVDSNDYPTQSLLQWFVDEQVEEEKSVGDALEMVKMAGDNPSALLMLNEKLSQRGSGIEADTGVKG